MEELRSVQGGVAEQVARQGRDQKPAMSTAQARVSRVVAAAGVLLVGLLVTMLGLLWAGAGRNSGMHAVSCSVRR